MRAKHNETANRDIGKVIGENNTACLEAFTDGFVVDNLVFYVERCANDSEGPFYGIDCTVDAGTKPTGSGHQNLHSAIIPIRVCSPVQCRPHPGLQRANPARRALLSFRRVCALGVQR